MKKLILMMFLCCSVGVANAEINQNSVIKYCGAMSGLAESTMRYRQKGLTLKDQLEVNEQYKESDESLYNILNQMAIDAYKVSPRPSPLLPA